MRSLLSLLSRALTFGLATILTTLAFFWPSPPRAMAQTMLLDPKVMNVAFLSFPGKRPDFIGVRDNKLAPCPASPNCVSSQASDAEHRIEALGYQSSPEQVIAHLKQVLDSQAGAKVITEHPDYLYAEYTSKLMGFVDDVEFYLNKDKGQIEVRSASRLGQSDLGVNRKRIEDITANFEALESQSSHNYYRVSSGSIPLL